MIFCRSKHPATQALNQKRSVGDSGVYRSRQPGKRHTLTAVIYRFGPVVEVTRVPSSESDTFVTVSPVSTNILIFPRRLSISS